MMTFILQGSSPLGIASLNGRLEVVKTLIETGATLYNVNQTNKVGAFLPVLLLQGGSCVKGHVDNHLLRVLHVHVPTMLCELLYPLQDGHTPLHLAAKEGDTTRVKSLLSTPGIDVNIKDRVSWSIEI